MKLFKILNVSSCLLIIGATLIVKCIDKPLLTGATVTKFSEPSTYWCLKRKTELEKQRCNIAKAQQAKNLSEVKRLTNIYIKLLGHQAGIPESPVRFRRLIVLQKAKLPKIDIATAFDAYVREIEKRAWWSSHPNPTAENQGETRDVASAISGLLAARRAGASHSNHLLQMAKDAGDYLLWSQEQAGKRLYPYPVMGGKSGRWGELALSSEIVGSSGRDWQVNQRLIRLASEQNNLQEVLINGWIVSDLGEGGSQYNNGLAGVAVLELYQASGEQKYLDSARLVADWAISQPVVPNWNYNAFSVYLLAKMYEITGDKRYLESAKEKARLGIYPGQLRSGARSGYWADPHNARLVYHYILVRGLSALVAILPKNDPDFLQAFNTLSLALDRNTELLKNGVPVNPDRISMATSASTVLEVLSRLKLDLPTLSCQKLNKDSNRVIKLLARYAISELARGQLPVEPASWGFYLETLSSNNCN